MARPHQLARGQTLAEYALVLPVLVLLFGGLALAGGYAFRAAAADWGVFITGVAAGAYDTPATDQVQASIVGADLRHGIATGSWLGARQVHAQINVVNSRSWLGGLQLVEAHRGTNYFRLWRFYPGPPEPGRPE